MSTPTHSGDIDLLESSGVGLETALRITGDALADADDGELFLEYSQSEALGWDNGRLKSASFDTSQGFGLRAVAGEAAGYAHVRRDLRSGAEARSRCRAGGEDRPHRHLRSAAGRHQHPALRNRQSAGSAGL